MLAGVRRADEGEVPDIEARVRSSFANQGLMSTLGATIGQIAPGRVEVLLAPTAQISQQHGFVHAAAVAAIADSAAGYSALTLAPAGAGVLTTEYKINLLAPAKGERLRAVGRVLKAGRTLTIVQADVFADTGDESHLIAVLTSTVMNIQGRDGITD
jgi:uncharacterized protein (TIGR00369 family)